MAISDMGEQQKESIEQQRESMEGMSDTGELQQVPHRLGPEYETGNVIGMCIFQYLRRERFNPLAAFDNVYKSKVARFSHSSKMSYKQIDEFFQSNLLLKDLPESCRVHFKSGNTWRNQMAELMHQPLWLHGTVHFHLQKGCAFYYRDVVITIAYYLRQKILAELLIYELVQEFYREGNRVFTEMHTEDWWWQTQG